MTEAANRMAPNQQSTQEEGNPLPSGLDSVAAKLPQPARDAVQQAQQTIAQGVQQAQKEGFAQFEGQKDAVVGTLGTVAGALHEASTQLRNSHQEPAAQLVDRAASQLDQVSDRLHHDDLNGLIREVETFARSQPWLFLGGAFAVGLLAARVLRPPTAGNSGWSSGASGYQPSRQTVASGNRGAAMPDWRPPLDQTAELVSNKLEEEPSIAIEEAIGVVPSSAVEH